MKVKSFLGLDGSDSTHNTIIYSVIGTGPYKGKIEVGNLRMDQSVLVSLGTRSSIATATCILGRNMAIYSTTNKLAKSTWSWYSFAIEDGSFDAWSG